jgi:hypothetical protein
VKQPNQLTRAWNDMSSVSQINSNMHGIANCLINALTGQVDFRTKSTCPVIRLIGTYLLF